MGIKECQAVSVWVLGAYCFLYGQAFNDQVASDASSHFADDPTLKKITYKGNVDDSSYGVPNDAVDACTDHKPMMADGWDPNGGCHPEVECFIRKVTDGNAVWS